MDIVEFETRYRCYDWLNRKFRLWRSTDQILSFVKISDGGKLEKYITDTNPDELKAYTLETFTPEKSEYIYNIAQNITIWWLNLADYINRVEYELKVIKEMGFYSYILIVQDFINRAKTHKIPVWPWRWSAAGSLLMYLVGIVDIDPMVFGLYFERFLNPSRVSMPDVDVDFDDEGREKVFDYVSEKYGHKNVSKIWTFSTMTAKAAFKDVSRALGIWFERANRITNLMTIVDDKKNVDIMKCFTEIEELKSQFDNDPAIKKTVEISLKLLKTIRQTWVHACGTLICPDNIPKFIPAQFPPNINSFDSKEWYVTQFDRWQPEDLWLLKMDFLWLSNISVIKNTIKIIYAQCKSNNKPIPEIFETYFEDSGFFPDIYDDSVYQTVFQKWNTTGIFQFESDGMTRYLVDLKPDRLEDLIAMTSLYRPWPMEFIPSFINRKHGTEEIIYGNTELFTIIEKNYSKEELVKQKKLARDDMNPILDVTYWVAVYQEQLMSMSVNVAWFSLSKADDLRKAIGKKIVDKVIKIKADFVKWALERWYKTETATWIYEKMIEPAALYSFNKSHAAAYSFISYQTAWLKTHYPVEFGAALLRSSENNTDDLAKFINEIKSNGIEVLAPNVNESFTHVWAINGKIRLWFLCIKWVWFEVSELVQNEREKNGKFNWFGDFLLRCQKAINKKSLEWFIKSGALSDFHNIATMLDNIEYILERTKLSADWWANGWLFGTVNEITLKISPEPSLMTRLKTEYEVFKAFVSWHPLDGIYTWVKWKYILISQFKNIENYGAFEMIWYIQRIQRAKKKWFFIKIEDISDTLEFFVKDAMDLEEFDIIYISGYKWRTAKWEKIVKIKQEDLVKFAINSGKYNAEDTVAAVKTRRLVSAAIPAENKKIEIPNSGTNIQTDENPWETMDDEIEIPESEEVESENEIENIDNEDNLADDLESENTSSIPAGKQDIYIEKKLSDWVETEKSIWKKNIDTTKNIKEEIMEEKIETNIYTMPSDIYIIKQLWPVIKWNPWNINVTIWTMNISVSKKWAEEIKQLIG